MRGAIFDMDGILFDTERIYQETWREVASEMGKTLPYEFTLAVSGAAKEAVFRAVSKYYETDDPEGVVSEVYERMRLKQEQPLPIKPGVIEILKGFRDGGAGIAVASSTYHEQVRKNLERNGLLPYFDAVVSGDEVRHTKPDPEIFLTAAEKIGVPPEECYVFEDSFNGIRAAHAAHSSAVMVVDLMEPDEEIRGIADYVFHSMTEAHEKLAFFAAF